MQLENRQIKMTQQKCGENMKTIHSTYICINAFDNIFELIDVIRPAVLTYAADEFECLKTQCGLRQPFGFCSQ